MERENTGKPKGNHSTISISPHFDKGDLNQEEGAYIFEIE